MNKNEFKNLVEESWRRKLTPAEESALKSYFATHAEAQILWRRESDLSRLLKKLSDVPVSTNFTSRVLQVVERDALQARGTSIFDWFKFSWLSRTAIASLCVCACLISVHQYRIIKRTQMAQEVAAISTSATVPQEWLQNFDAIDRLGQLPVDDELLAALQ